MSSQKVTLVDLIDDFDGCDNAVTFVNENGCDDVLYSQLAKDIRSEAALHRAAGLAGGQRVLVSLTSSRRAVTRFLALIEAGAVPVSVKPRNVAFGDYEQYIQHIAAQQHASAYFEGDTERPEWINGLPARAHTPSRGRNRASRDDVAFVQYTSGSIASPKPIPLSHGSVMHNISELVRRERRTCSDCMLNVIPLCHDMGLIGGVLGSFLERNPLIVVDTKWFLRSPVSVLELGMRRQVTVAPIPNFVVRYLTRILRLKSNAAPYFDTWKSIYIGSERITKETIEQFISVGARFALHPRSLIFSYGMAEAALMVTSYRFTNMAEAFDDEVDGSSHANNGMPLDGIEVEFGDAAGSYREIKVRGESLFSSSESPLERTSTWHHTGDVGYRKGGNLFIVGRIRDSITVDGTNVHAADVEEALSNEMAVEQCICEPIDGVLHVWLVTKRTDPVDAERVTRLLRRLFGISKSQVATIRPAQVARTTSGKIMKQVTVQRLLSASCTHVSHKPVCQEHTAA